MKSQIPEIDVHGFSRLKAKEFIYEELEKYRKKGIYAIRVIHGWNNGTVIRTWLNNSSAIKKDLRINKIEEDILNPGVTYIYLAL